MYSPAGYSAKGNLTRKRSSHRPGIPEMKLPELLRSINTVAQTGGSAEHCESLAREIRAIADMVGWSMGPIDRQGLLLNRLAALQADLELRHAQTGDVAIAVLHDALTDLGRAIAGHDDDLDPGHSGDDDGEDFC